MRLSVFNHYVTAFPEADETLIHNTFSGAYVVLPTAVVEALRRGERGDALELTGEVDARELSAPDVGVLVASLAQEELEFQQWFSRRRALNRRLEVVVGINLACNFACTYCLQDGVLDGTVMKEAIADATADWLLGEAKARGLTAVHLVFVGGEPLLHAGRIERIAGRVRDGASALTFSLITNGYFLTAEMVDRLLPHGLCAAQVTLDGDETTHATTRVCKSGESTFRRIFDNVVMASRKIRISVNGNYQVDTLHGFGPLLRQLAQVLPPRSHVSFSPALETIASPPGSGSGACSWSGSDTSYQTALWDEGARHGFLQAPLNVVGPCEFHDVHAFAIDPTGTIYKCPGFLGLPEWGIGHVSGSLTARYDEMLALTPKQTPCGGCSHRPDCGGGCVAAEWIRTGDTSGVNCERDYFESIQRDATIRGYLLATSDDLEQAVSQFPEPPRRLPGPPPDQRKRVRSSSLRVLATSQRIKGGTQ